MAVLSARRRCRLDHRGRFFVIDEGEIELVDHRAQVDCSEPPGIRGRVPGLFRRWADGKHGLSESIEAYLGSVYVNPSFITGEGVVESLWSRGTDPWVPFDREAVLNYKSTEDREKSKKFPAVEADFESIQAVGKDSRWKELKSGGRKVDQLAIDPEGSGLDRAEGR